MAIQYSMVARGAVVLSEFNSGPSDASAIARQILEKVAASTSYDAHVSYSQGIYVFHVKRADGITVLCMAEETAGRRVPFSFLEDIYGRFVKTYGLACHTALAYAMNDEFSRVLNQQMDFHSTDPNADRINRIKGEMSQVHNIMIQNIEKVLERGDRLELLVDRTANMQGNTIRFKRQTRRIRNSMWWQNIKLMVTLILLLLVIISIILAFVCQGITLPSCIR